MQKSNSINVFSIAKPIGVAKRMTLKWRQIPLSRIT